MRIVNPPRPKPPPPEPPAESSRPSNYTLPDDRLKEIQAAVEASPSKIAVIVARDHQVPGPSMHASKLYPFAPGHPSWDHVAVAWMDANGKLVFGEARPDNGALGAVFAGKISPGTARELVSEYKDFKVLPIDLSRYGPGARDRFVNAVSEVLKPGASLYSLHKGLGNVCSSAIGIGFEAARNARPPGWLVILKTIVEKVALGLVSFLTDLHSYTPKEAYLEALKHSVPGYRFDPAKPLVVEREWLKIASSSAAVASLSDEASASLLGAIGSASLLGAIGGEKQASPFGGEEQASPFGQPAPASDTDAARSDVLQPATDHGEQVFQQVVEHPSDDQDDEDALTVDSLQNLETDAGDDEDALEHEVTLASHPEHTPDPAQQPEIDHDEDELALVSDPQDAPPAIDDDDEQPSQEDDKEHELADASDAEDAPAADAPVMQTAKAEASADATADGQPGPQLAISAPATADDGFSFSLIPKPAASLEVAKEALPAEQASPVEESSGSETPRSEGAHPDLDSAGVGNAAPSKGPVVHLGELAP